MIVRQLHGSQVKLKVQIVEIDRSKLAQFGINLFSQGKNTSNVTTGQFPSTQTYTPGSGTTPATLTSSNPLNVLFYNFDVNFGLTLQDLQNKNIAQILAEPTITTFSGQKASFLAGGEFPFPVVQGSSGGLTSITIQFRPYGVKLEFTPLVNDDGTIQLKVAPEVSALDYTNAVTISGYTIPAISTRRADTQVELRDGQSFAISGLLDHRTTDIFSKMPGIGDVPVLGQLFRSKNVNHSTVELMVVVTPTVVDPLTDTTSPILPKLPVPLLDPAQFDKKTGNRKPATQPNQDWRSTMMQNAHHPDGLQVALLTVHVDQETVDRSARRLPACPGSDRVDYENYFSGAKLPPLPSGRSTPRLVLQWLISMGIRERALETAECLAAEFLSQDWDSGSFVQHRSGSCCCAPCVRGTANFWPSHSTPRNSRIR